MYVHTSPHVNIYTHRPLSVCESLLNYTVYRETLHWSTKRRLLPGDRQRVGDAHHPFEVTSCTFSSLLWTLWTPQKSQTESQPTEAPKPSKEAVYPLDTLQVPTQEHES